MPDSFKMMGEKPRIKSLCLICKWHVMGSVILMHKLNHFHLH